MRVAMTAGNGIWNEFDSSEGLLPLGWHHIAVAIDGDAMTLVRSQYTADSYFAGSLDELRIYNRVLS